MRSKLDTARRGRLSKRQGEPDHAGGEAEQCDRNAGAKILGESEWDATPRIVTHTTTSERNGIKTSRRSFALLGGTHFFLPQPPNTRFAGTPGSDPLGRCEAPGDGVDWTLGLPRDEVLPRPELGGRDVAPLGGALRTDGAGCDDGGALGCRVLAAPPPVDRRGCDGRACGCGACVCGRGCEITGDDGRALALAPPAFGLETFGVPLLAPPLLTRGRYGGGAGGSGRSLPPLPKGGRETRGVSPVPPPFGGAGTTRTGDVAGVEERGTPASRRPRDGSCGARVATTGRFSVAAGGRFVPPPVAGLRLAGVARTGSAPRIGSTLPSSNRSTRWRPSPLPPP
jgi:hypothetical protein